MLRRHSGGLNTILHKISSFTRMQRIVLAHLHILLARKCENAVLPNSQSPCAAASRMALYFGLVWPFNCFCPSVSVRLIEHMRAANAVADLSLCLEQCRAVFIVMYMGVPSEQCSICMIVLDRSRLLRHFP